MGTGAWFVRDKLHSGIFRSELLIALFKLSIRLKMLYRNETSGCTQYVTKSLSYLGDELGSTVRNNVHWYAMKLEDMLDHELSGFES